MVFFFNAAKSPKMVIPETETKIKYLKGSAPQQLISSCENCKVSSFEMNSVMPSLLTQR